MQNKRITYTFQDTAGHSTEVRRHITRSKVTPHMASIVEIVALGLKRTRFRPPSKVVAIVSSAVRPPLPSEFVNKGLSRVFLGSMRRLHIFARP